MYNNSEKFRTLNPLQRNIIENRATEIRLIRFDITDTIAIGLQLLTALVSPFLLFNMGIIDVFINGPGIHPCVGIHENNNDK